MVDEDNFLRRWSRRKHESARRQPAAAPAEQQVPPQPAPAAPGASPAPSQPEPAPLPPVDSLKGLASDYKEFLDPAVDENLRRSALKKLFHDPHFNVMDGLDVYIDDYSKPDPIPESMLKGLLARHVGLADPAEQRAAPAEQPAQGDADARAADGSRADSGLPAPEAGPSEPVPAADPAPQVPGRPEEEKR
jgi:Protein of unknown function (DUF3306)